MQPPRRIAVDFDNTLCEDRYPDIGPPKPGAKAALATLRKLGYQIIIWTCRTCHWDYDVYGGDPGQPVMERTHVKAMQQWLADNGMEYDVIDDGSKGKPSATYYIDDKGIQFVDNWAQITLFITSQEFKESPAEPAPEPKEGQKRCRIIPFRTLVPAAGPIVETTPFPPQVA